MNKLLLASSLAAIATLSACQKAPEAPAAPAAPAPVAAAPAAPAEAAPVETVATVLSTQVPTGQATAKDIPEGGSCSLDGFNGQPAIEESVLADRDAPLALSGWAAAEIDGKFPTQTYLLLVGNNTKSAWFAPIASRFKRPDVAQSLNKPMFEEAGINVLANAAPLQPDVYQVKFVMNLGKASVVCDTKKRVKLN